MSHFVCIWNPTEEKVSTVIHGSHFNFPAGSFKVMESSKGDFIDQYRMETGLVTLRDSRLLPDSDSFLPGFERTKEAESYLAPHRERGIQCLIKHHLMIVQNNQMALRQDLAVKYPSGDSARMAAANASPGELESMRLVAKYKKKAGDNEAKRVDEVLKLMEDVGPIGI